MKKLIFFIPLLLSFFSGMAQPRINRQTGASNTLVDQLLHVERSFRTPVYNDTSQANNLYPHLDSCGAMIFTYDVMAHWSRACSPKRWIRIGKTIDFENSTTISFSGTGEANDPVIANLIVSQQGGNAVQTFGDGVFVESFVKDGLTDGGLITWVSGYTYDISPAQYVIRGIQYTAPQTQVTLANSDATYDRFDAFVANSNGTITVITGVPSDDPLRPSTNAATQVPLGFVLVTANSTSPNPNQEWIYQNYFTNAWTTAPSTGTINDQSTVNSFSVPTNVEFTAALIGHNIRFTDPTPPNIADFTVLSLKIRSKAVWSTNTRIVMQFYSGATPVGTSVSLNPGVFGFNSAQITTYQIITIPLSSFGALTSVTAFLMTVQTAAGLRQVNAYVDDIQLQNGIAPATGDFWALGGNTVFGNGVFGTKDNFPIRYITNNNEVARLTTTGNFLLGRTADQGGGYRLQTLGGIYADVTGTAEITFVGMATNNTATQVASKDSLGNLVWRDASSISGSISANNGLTMSTAINVQLGGTLIGTTTINAQNFTLNVSGSIYPFISTTTGTTTAIRATTLVSDAATVYEQFSVRRETTGTAANGIGGSIVYTTEVSDGNTFTSNKLISKWTDATSATRTSQFILQGVNSAVTADLLTISGSGSTRLNKYGVGSFTAGTPAYSLVVDASGNIMEGATGGGVYTASNGLTMLSNNVKLGGTLIEPTTINTGGFNTTFTGNNASPTPVLTVTNTNGVSSSVGISASSNGTTISASANGAATYAVSASASGSNSTAVYGTASGSNAYAIWGNASGATALSGVFNQDGTGTSDVIENMRIYRTTSGTAANGIGNYLTYFVETSTGATLEAARAGATWTDATNATRTSSYFIGTYNNAVQATKLTISGNGALRLHTYGINTHTGVVAYNLGVDASGNVIEVAAAGGGMTNPMTTTGDIIYSSPGATPVRLGIGTAGQVLTVVAGVPGWTTVAGTGSVTTVSVVSANGFAGTVANPTTTPAITLTTSITGILKGNGTAISAAVAGTDYLTVLTGDATTSGNAITLATVNSNVGTFGSSTSIPTFTVNAKGLITAASGNVVIAPAGTLTGTTLNATVVTSSLTSVGTITTGVWNGTAIAAIRGGTSFTSYATGDLIYASSVNTLSKLAIGTTGQVLTVNAGGVPVWGAATAGGTVTSVTGTANRITITGTPTIAPIVDIAATYVGQTSITTLGVITTGTWSGTTIAADRGGTGHTTPYTNGQILIGNGTGLTKATITGTTNQINVSNGVGSITLSLAFNPAWQNLTDGATVTWNAANGGNARLTLNGTGRTVNVTNPVDGYTLTLVITQGSGGLKTITTWPTGTRWPNGSAPDLSDAAGAIDVVTLTYDAVSARWIGDYAYNF